MNDASAAGEPAQQPGGRAPVEHGLPPRRVGVQWRVLVALQVLALTLVVAAVVAAWLLGLTQPVYNSR